MASRADVGMLRIRVEVRMKITIRVRFIIRILGLGFRVIIRFGFRVGYSGSSNLIWLFAAF